MIGFKDSGKTRVVEMLVRELVRRGYRVGTAKHIGDSDFSMDEKGKDTWRHAEAGASVILCMAANEFVRIEKERRKIQQIVEQLRGLDFFILEGFRELRNIAKIAVLRDSSEAGELVDDLTLGCVGSKIDDKPFFSFDDLDKLADLVEERAFPILPELNCEWCGYKSCKELRRAIIVGQARWDACLVLKERVKLLVDDEPVPLNPFVQDLLSRVVQAIAGSLKRAQGKKITIEVKLDEG